MPTNCHALKKTRMADSINLDIGYFDHIKTVRLASMLGRGAEMLPVRLWCYCGMHPKDNGALTDFSANDVEAVVLKWWGKPGQAVEAMVKCGFLDFDGTTYIAHGFNEKNGHIIAFHHRAVHAANVRWGKLDVDVCSSIAKGNATSMAKQCPTDRPTVLPTKSKDKDGAGKFVPPSPQEVSEYGKTIGFSIDGEKFVAFYQASGWYRGKSKIKDWKAAVVTWKRKSQPVQSTQKQIQKPQDLDAMLKLQGLV